MHPVSCSRHGHHHRHGEFRSLHTPPPSTDDPYDDYVHVKPGPKPESFQARNHHHHHRHHVHPQHPDDIVHTDVPRKEERQPRFTHSKPHHHHRRHNIMTPPPSLTPSPPSVRHHVHYHEYQRGPQFQHRHGHQAHHTTKPGSPLSTEEGEDDDNHDGPRLHTHCRPHYKNQQHQHQHHHQHHVYPPRTRGQQYRDPQTHTSMHTHTHIHAPGYTNGHIPSCFGARSRHDPGKCGCRHQHQHHGHGHGQRGGGVKQFAYGPPLPIFVMAFPGGGC